MLVQGDAGYGSHPAVYQSASNTHAFERHVGGLAVVTHWGCIAEII